MASVRSIGSAVINFGMVSIPVKFYTAARDERVSFNLLHDACGSKISQPTHCPKCERAIDRSTETVKGLEVAKDQFVTFSDDDMKALEATADPAVEIKEFVPATSVDPVYFDSATYIGPDKGADKAFALLTYALLQTDTVALAQRTFRGKEQLVAIRATDAGLCLHVLHYANEVVDPRIIVEKLAAVTDEEIALAKDLVGRMTQQDFYPQAYHDTFGERVMEAAKAKQTGEILTIPVVAVRAPAADVIAALRASLGQPTKTAPVTQGKRPATKSAPAKRGGREARS